MTLAILYSNDRRLQLQQTISCINEMSLQSKCQKLLIVDGIFDKKVKVDDFQVIELQREKNFYCWGNAWDKIVENAKHDIVLYLDSDRILPQNYLKLVVENINDNLFLFPLYLYSTLKDLPLSFIKEIRDELNSDYLNYKKYSNFISPDHRIFSNPVDAIRKKNPMSGCVAFTKKTFYDSGGLDKSYIGWGYPDTDYFMQTYKMGCNFLPLHVSEIHLFHNYDDGGKKFLNRREVRLMGLWNGVKFCKKWDIPIHASILKLAEEMQINIELVKKNNLENFLNNFSKPKRLL